jgi:hypothetical protein
MDASTIAQVICFGVALWVIAAPEPRRPWWRERP